MAERWTRERRPEHTRSLLLDAAEEVFGEKGFVAATLDGIAYAAGYTKGAIYKHFSAKEDLSGGQRPLLAAILRQLH